MSIDATNWVWSLGLRTTTKFVLIRLADRANGSNTCWPSIASIASDTGLSDRAVLTSISEVEKLGLVTVTRKMGIKSIYLLNVGKRLNQCNTFTSEPHSPVNDVHPTSAPRSPHQCTTFTPTSAPRSPPPVHHVHPNLPVESTNESSMNLPFNPGEDEKKNHGDVLTSNGDTENGEGRQFTDFWQAYPDGYRMGRKAAQAAWVDGECNPIAAIIVADVTWRYSQDVRWQDGYIPKPENYITGRRWEDDILTKRPEPTKNKQKGFDDDLSF